MTGGRVVVLGPTGRNFAAGMSGGIAYVSTTIGDFTTRALQHARPSSLRGDRRGDAIELRELIDRARARTGSAVAERMLADWDASLQRFVKVMPNDYRRVLDEQAALAGELAEVSSYEASVQRPLMGELRGFMRVAREPIPERDALERAHDYREFTLTRPVAELRDQGARCMDCGVPFCHNGCPLGNLIPDWNDLVYRDRWQDAIDAAAPHEQLPRVHRAPLPGAVRGGVRARDQRGRRGDDQADRELRSSTARSRRAGCAPQPPALETGRRVAVVGSGPGRSGGGTAAAARRARASSSSSATRRPAGWSASACPTSRSRSALVERRVDQLLAEGVELRLGVDVGVDIDAAELRAEFDAVVLAIGSRVPRDLDGPRARAGGRPLRDGVPLRAQPLGRRRVRARAGVARPPSAEHHRGGQARRRDRRRRHRRGLCRQRRARGRELGHRSSRSCRSRRRTVDDALTPWPRWPTKLRLSYAMKEVARLATASSTSRS